MASGNTSSSNDNGMSAETYDEISRLILSLSIAASEQCHWAKLPAELRQAILMRVVNQPDTVGHTFGSYMRFADAAKKLRMVNKDFQADINVVKGQWRKMLKSVIDNQSIQSVLSSSG